MIVLQLMPAWLLANALSFLFIGKRSEWRLFAFRLWIFQTNISEIWHILTSRWTRCLWYDQVY